MNSDFTFECFWNEIKIATQIIFDNIPKELRREYSVQVHLLPIQREMVFYRYNEHRNFVHKKMFSIGDGNKKIDIHKIIACIIWALTQVNLITFENKNKIPPQILSAKYAIAIMSAMRILYRLMLSELTQRNDITKKIF